MTIRISCFRGMSFEASLPVCSFVGRSDDLTLVAVRVWNLVVGDFDSQVVGL